MPNDVGTHIKANGGLAESEGFRRGGVGSRGGMERGEEEGFHCGGLAVVRVLAEDLLKVQREELAGGGGQIGI